MKCGPFVLAASPAPYNNDHQTHVTSLFQQISATFHKPLWSPSWDQRRPSGATPRPTSDLQMPLHGVESFHPGDIIAPNSSIRQISTKRDATSTSSKPSWKRWDHHRPPGANSQPASDLLMTQDGVGSNHSSDATASCHRAIFVRPSTRFRLPTNPFGHIGISTGRQK
jgi:hypothetical protein